LSDVHLRGRRGRHRSGEAPRPTADEGPCPHRSAVGASVEAYARAAAPRCPARPERRLRRQSDVRVPAAGGVPLSGPGCHVGLRSPAARPGVLRRPPRGSGGLHSGSQSPHPGDPLTARRADALGLPPPPSDEPASGDHLLLGLPRPPRPGPQRRHAGDRDPSAQGSRLSAARHHVDLGREQGEPPAGGKARRSTNATAAPLSKAPHRNPTLTYRSTPFRTLPTASRAASAHNTQPARWRFEPDGTVHLFEDLTRRLPVADPTGHDGAIGLGAAFEGLHLALSRRGIRLLPLAPSETSADAMAPDSIPPALRLVGCSSLVSTKASDPLARFALERRTLRRRFLPTHPHAREGLDKLLALPSR